MPEYLTTRELAELLRIKERKVYELAAQGAVPCSRVTGKLLFPEAAVRAWLDSASSGPVGASGPAIRRTVFLGSHDPLLDWALRESRAGLATFFDGSLDGLDRFAAGEGVATGLHVLEPTSGQWNLPAATAACAGLPCVLVGWAWRQRGLVLRHEDAATIRALPDLAGRRLAPRQSASGAAALFDHLAARAGLDPATVERTRPMRSEADVALAVHDGTADATFGLATLATQYLLAFVPLVRERFDLLIDRHAFFEPPLQRFFAFCRSDTFRERAASMAGYETDEVGSVRWNAPAC